MIGHIDQLFLIAFAHRDVGQDRGHHWRCRIRDHAERNRNINFGLVGASDRKRQAFFRRLIVRRLRCKFFQTVLQKWDGARHQEFVQCPALRRFIAHQAKKLFGCSVIFNNPAGRGDCQNTVRNVLDNRGQLVFTVTDLLFCGAQLIKCC